MKTLNFILYKNICYFLRLHSFRMLSSLKITGIHYHTDTSSSDFFDNVYLLKKNFITPEELFNVKGNVWFLNVLLYSASM